MLISTDREKCRRCYACVRNCPVKAVKIKMGQAEVLESRCIECGNCVQVCSQNAKKVLDFSQDVKSLLNRSEHVSVILAPSFVTGFAGSEPLKVVSALKRLRFYDVWEASLGAQLLVPRYEALLRQDKMVISSPCPAVVTLVEKHFSPLLPYLAPVLSPMAATARYIKRLYPGRKIVFAGPCIAKKGEVLRLQGLLDYALTFTELNDLLKKAEIDVAACPPEKMAGPSPFINGQIIPLPGGLTKMLNASTDLLETDHLVVDGQAECCQTLKAIAKGELRGKFIDILMCRGCIDGPARLSSDNYHTRKNTVVRYFESVPLQERFKGKMDLAGEANRLELDRSFVNRETVLPEPDEIDVVRILTSIGKYSRKDETNCGACGFSSCREKAVAVCQGIAEVEMCLPYLLDQKEKLLTQLDEELAMIRLLNRELDSIVESSYDGICVTDSKGNILKTNKAFENLYDLHDAVGASAAELEKRKILCPEVTMLVIKERRPVTFLQHAHNGRRLHVTGTPIFGEDGRLVKILINSRDFEELDQLKQQIEDNISVSERIRTNNGTDNIIACSESMFKVLDVCRKIAKVDTNVLITGESGVGKEIVAGYIDSMSKRKNGPWIKVNCGAIPENLIESELFGYEAGSFTGARKEGKKGLFEVADQGTIFLDEIGELPYNLQVKLLQMLQEKCLVRIGGVKPIMIDTRIIAATNRKMLAKGKFRQDLYYRLNVVPVPVPPLRHRKEDIIPLANYFLGFFNKKYGLNKKYGRDVLRIFHDYDWPGNIRELMMNLVERLVVTLEQEVIGRDCLPSYLSEKGFSGYRETDGELPASLQEAVENLEKDIFQKAYRVFGNSYKIAEALGVNQSTVVRKLKKYGIT